MALRKVTGSQVESLPLGFDVTEELLASGDASLQAILDSQEKIPSNSKSPSRGRSVAASHNPSVSYVARSN